MAEYIERSAVIAIADYAADEHPYDKDPARPETYSDYNQGWNDACDYIRGRLESAKPADVAPVVHGRWEDIDTTGLGLCTKACCSYCRKPFAFGLYINGKKPEWDYCPNCGAKMDLED